MKGYYLFHESNMIVQRIQHRIFVIILHNSEYCTDITSKKKRSLKSLCTILSIAQFCFQKEVIECIDCCFMPIPLLCKWLWIVHKHFWRRLSFVNQSSLLWYAFVMFLRLSYFTSFNVASGQQGNLTHNVWVYRNMEDFLMQGGECMVLSSTRCSSKSTTELTGYCVLIQISPHPCFAHHQPKTQLYLRLSGR